MNTVYKYDESMRNTSRKWIVYEYPPAKILTKTPGGIREQLEERKKDGALFMNEFMLGRLNNGEIATGSPETLTHVLIGGQTGAGKSVLMNTMIGSLLMTACPTTTEIIILDTKRVDSRKYKKLNYRPFLKVINDTEEIRKFLGDTVEEMKERYRRLEEEDKDYTECAKMKRKFIFCDELADLMFEDKRNGDALIRLAQMGRAAGIMLILATQKPLVKVVPSLLKANLPTTIALKTHNQTDSVVLLGHKGAETIRTKGGAILQMQTGDEFEIQTPLTLPEDIERLITHINKQLEQLA